MRFGHVKPTDNSVLFGKDIWNPKGFLFIVQFKHIRFFGNVGKDRARNGIWPMRTPPKRSTTISCSAPTA